jgi:hypothetical protein
MKIVFVLKDVRYLKVNFMGKKKKIFYENLEKITKIWLIFLKFQKKRLKIFKRNFFLIEKIVIFLICNLSIINSELKIFFLRIKKNFIATNNKNKLNKRLNLITFFNLFIFYKKIKFKSFLIVLSIKKPKIMNLYLIFCLKWSKFTLHFKQKLKTISFFIIKVNSILVNQLKIKNKRFFVKSINSLIFFLPFSQNLFNWYLIIINVINLKIKTKIALQLKKCVKFISIVKFFSVRNIEQKFVYTYLKYIKKFFKNSKSKYLALIIIFKKYLETFLLHFNFAKTINSIIFSKNINEKIKLLTYKNKNEYLILPLLINILKLEKFFFIILYIYSIIVNQYFDLMLKNSLLEIEGKLNLYICIFFLKNIYNNVFL